MGDIYLLQTQVTKQEKQILLLTKCINLLISNYGIQTNKIQEILNEIVNVKA